MFFLGQPLQWGFWTSACQTSHGTLTQQHVQMLDPGFLVQDLSGGPGLMCFLKTNGNAFVVSRSQREDGGREKGRQKFLKWKEKIQAVSCGDQEGALLTRSGALLCVDATHTPLSPRPLPGLSAMLFCQVSCGSRHSLALTRDGQVYSWGLDSRGQLGLGASGSRGPQQVCSLRAVPVVQIAAGGEQSFAISVSGGVFGWGGNGCGQLGLGDTADRRTPTCVRSLNGKKSRGVSCGVDHTAVLTQDGVVFTFGSGRHGQLGHNSSRNELRPRLVAELWGSKVVKVTCGSHHTLVLTLSGKVFSFGNGDEGQLGREAERHPSVPLHLHLPPGHRVREIFAGGNFSLAISDQNDARDLSSDGGSTLSSLDDVINHWVADCDTKSWRKYKKELSRIFSSASCWNRSFLERRGDKHFLTSPKFPGLDLPAARRAFKKLMKMEGVHTALEAALQCLLRQLDGGPPGVEGLRVYLLFVELLHVAHKCGWQRCGQLVEALAGAIVCLQTENLQVLGSWWSSLARSVKLRHVTVWKQTLVVALSSTPVPRHTGIKNLLVALQYFYDANSRVEGDQRLADRLFCLPLTLSFLREELGLWQSQSQCRVLRHCDPLVLGRFPFVMDLQAKKLVFEVHAAETQEAEVSRLSLDFYWKYGWTTPTPDDFMLVLELNRESVLEDTLELLALAGSREFKRPLGVLFDQNLDHPGYPLYLKDFFYKVFHEAVSPGSGMFMFNDSGTLAWFSSKTVQDLERFCHFGVLCGLALYNNYIIYLPFPLVLFKKLLGGTPSLEDMMEFSPCLGGSLLSILNEYGDDVLEQLSQDFSVHWDGTDVDLDPKNPQKPLTSQNKKEFVDAYVKYAFGDSVDSVFQEFLRGFFLVCEPRLVKQFTPRQLQEVLVGEDFHQWEALRQNTEYRDGYHDNHPNINMFWEVFQELTEPEKKSFLWFVTGFERVPIVNENRIMMTIALKNVPDPCQDQYYPEAYTCTSILLLPLYSNKVVMKVKLREALNNAGAIYR